MSTPDHQPDIPPHAQLVQMMTGFMTFRAIYVAAKLGLPDLMIDGGADAADLAVRVGTDPRALYRLLRMLAGLGIFREDAPGRFKNTPMGDALRSDHPGKAYATALTFGSRATWSAWGELEDAVASGRSAFSIANGKGVFDFLAENPDDAKWFNDTMIGFHGSEPPAVAKVYDASGIDHVVDVGGGTGNLITMLLNENPHLKGTLYDLPHVTEHATTRIASLGLQDRCDVVSGDFFETVPAGESYVISHIIHDWDDDRSVTILKNCKRANPEANVRLIETLVPEGNDMHFAKLMDIVMMVHTEGGQERTEAEYRELFDKAGYRLEQIVPTESPVSIIEGVPA
jgi:hypothetical protein